MPRNEGWSLGLGELGRALADALLLVDTRGRIQDANAPACRLLQQPRDGLVGAALGDVVQTSPEILRGYLRNCSGSRQPVIGALEDARGRALRSEGAVVFPGSTDGPVQVLLRLRPRDATTQRFRMLTEKLESLAREIVQRVRAESLLEGQRRALEMIARGAALEETLEELVRTVETLCPEKVLSSVLLLDEEGRLHHGAGSGLPANYRRAIDGIEIGPSVGSCGTAAFLKRQVVVRDIANDPLWKDFRDLALSAGLRACWSTPIESREGQVLGTFALYYHEPRDPDPESERIVSLVTRTASVAIERQREESRIRQLLESERQARNAAEAADRAKDQFLALVSHELRNPLNAILGWTRLLRMDELDAATFSRGIETVERNAEIQAQLISDLLDISRLSTGKFSMEALPGELTAIVRGGVESLLPVAAENGLVLEAQPATDELPVLGDPDRLLQVVANLVGNALKFTPSGGRIVVTCRRVGDEAELCVQDNGRGIAPELLSQIFEQFRQGDASVARDQGGLGLGLAVVRHIVERHHGTVRAESEGVGCGATFTVRLPIRADARQSESTARASTAPSLDGVRILVVEDSADALDLVETTLSLQGAQVTALASATRALELLSRERFDVLISDIGMPDLDGYAFLRRVRRDGEGGSSVRALALTAYASDRDRSLAAEAGYDAHLAKPFEPDRLVDTVRRLIAG